MRAYYYEYLVDGVPILVPDANLSISRTDLDASDTGRDESGYMHRIIVRERVQTWKFSYSDLTAEEYLYMTSLFSGKPEFSFTYRGIDGEEKTTTAYCSNDSITYRNARTGLYKNFKFNIIEC